MSGLGNLLWYPLRHALIMGWLRQVWGHEICQIEEKTR